MTTDELIVAARQAALGSYSPYSGYRVGAVAVAEDGTTYSSANVENASYPVSQCAEANAVNFAVSQGHRRIPTVAVACIDATDLDNAYPCGRCRQILYEFEVEKVIIAMSSGAARILNMSDLLPHGFKLASLVRPTGGDGESSEGEARA